MTCTVTRGPVLVELLQPYPVRDARARIVGPVAPHLAHDVARLETLGLSPDETTSGPACGPCTDARNGEDPYADRELVRHADVDLVRYCSYLWLNWEETVRQERALHPYV